VILELRNNLNEGSNANGSANNYAPVVSLDNRPRVDNRSTLALLEPFDLLADNMSNGSGIGIQNVAGGNNEFVFANAASSPLKVGLVGSGYGISSGSNSHGNGKVTFLGLQNQATSGFDIDNRTDADLNPAKWIIDADQVFSYFYAGFEKKDINNPGNKQVQRKRSQEGSWTVDVKVETRNQGIDHNYCSSAEESGKGSVLEILHGLSLTEEEVG
jgi:hypothetical protein